MSSPLHETRMESGVSLQRCSTVSGSKKWAANYRLEGPDSGRSEESKALDMVPLRMVVTPWGDSRRLSEKTLPPGRGTTAAEAEQNHRERLYGAMVANVAEKG